MSSSRLGTLRPRPDLPARVRGPRPAVLFAVCVLLFAVAVCDLLALYAGFRTHSAVQGDGDFLFAQQAELDRADALFTMVDRFGAPALLACAAVFVAWFHRMRRAVGALAPDGFRLGPGWAIGAWFVPVACLWMPYRIAVEMWAACLRGEARGVGAAPSFWPVNLWWGSFAGSLLLRWYSGLSYRRAEGLAEMLDAVTVGMVGDMLNVLAAGAAAYFAVRLTRIQVAAGR
ncbi:DUF4328 domain-containing protein [Streptomyces sp. NPDC017254]|uniref:DUF4328 domain-containing protein n=1 Tax=unclassified Streptomyces TaxID=2593676 RepID=UPI0037B05CFE